MRITLKNTPEQEALVKAMGSNNAVEAREAQEAFARSSVLLLLKLSTKPQLLVLFTLTLLTTLTTAPVFRWTFTTTRATITSLFSVRTSLVGFLAPKTFSLVKS